MRKLTISCFALCSSMLLLSSCSKENSQLPEPKVAVVAGSNVYESERASGFDQGKADVQYFYNALTYEANCGTVPLPEPGQGGPATEDGTGTEVSPTGGGSDSTCRYWNFADSPDQLRYNVDETRNRTLELRGKATVDGDHALAAYYQAYVEGLDFGYQSIRM